MDTEIAVSIIGDAFADLLCYLDPSDSLPKPGGDARLAEPIRTVAGGSGLNTATHLRALVRDFGIDDGNTVVATGVAPVEVIDEIQEQISMRIELQTVLNERDSHGQILTEHAARHGVRLINRLPPSSTAGTGHCAVVVSRGERSFLTHRGCVADFDASLIDQEGIVDSTLSPELRVGGERRHHRHVHIAGYYNMPGFWDGKLKAVLSSALDRRRRETDRVTATTTVSLVPQHDATEEWSGGILDILPAVDFLILSELEGQSIFNQHSDTFKCSNDEKKTISLDCMARFFHSASPTTWVVLTLGEQGAVVLFEGRVILSRDAPVVVANPLDPTGAGDAFAAGFLFGSLQCLRRGDIGLSEGTKEEKGAGSLAGAVKEGLLWGTAVGTGCVNRSGASVPAPKDQIESLLQRTHAFRD